MGGITICHLIEKLGDHPEAAARPPEGEKELAVLLHPPPPPPPLSPLPGVVGVVPVGGPVADVTVDGVPVGKHKKAGGWEVDLSPLDLDFYQHVSYRRRGDNILDSFGLITACFFSLQY